MGLLHGVMNRLNDGLRSRFGVQLVRNSTIEGLQSATRKSQSEARNLLFENENLRQTLTPRDPLNTWVLAEVDGKRIWGDLGDYGVSRPCMFGNYEPAETSFVRNVLKQGDVFIDIGANIGWFTLLAAEIVGPKGRVYAFEPRPDTCDRLRMSAAVNGHLNIEIRQVALGSEVGRMTVATLLSAHNPGGTWSLATKALQDTLREGYERIEVDVIRLDDFALDRCDLLKIDIEGAEPLALSGATETLRRLQPIIISEINPEPLRQVSGVSVPSFLGFVEGLGYRCHSLTAIGPGPALASGFAAELKELINVVFMPM